MASELCVTTLPSAGKYDDVCENWWFDWSDAASPPHGSFLKARECSSSQGFAGLSLRTTTDQNASFSSSTAIEDKYFGSSVQVPCMASELEREVAELEAAEQEAKADRVELELSSCTAGMTFDTSRDSNLHADTAGLRDAEDDGMDTSSDQFVSDADPKTATSEEDETSAWHAVDDSSLDGELLMGAVKPEPVYGPTVLPAARPEKPRGGRFVVQRSARFLQRGIRRMHTVVSSNFGHMASDDGMPDAADQGLEECGAWQPADGEHSSGKSSFSAGTSPHSLGQAAAVGMAAKRVGTTVARSLLTPLVTGPQDDMSEDGANECGLENDAPSPGRSLSGSNGSREDLLHASSTILQDRADDDLEDGTRTARASRPVKMPIEGMTSPRGKKRASSSSKSGPAPGFHACTQCGTQTTPVWRAGPHGPKTLCNACGVRYMKIAKKR